MTQKGLHTWDLILDYHRCPQCGFIVESREDYVKAGTKKIKKLTCPRCQHAFAIEKHTKKSLTPLIGDPQPVEVDWE